MLNEVLKRRDADYPPHSNRRSDRLLAPLVGALLKHPGLLKRLPPLPRWATTSKAYVPPPMRTPRSPKLPEALRTEGGPIQRDEELAWAAYREMPLREFWVVYRHWEDWIFRSWGWLLPVLPGYFRGNDLAVQASTVPGSQAPHTAKSPAELREFVRDHAQKLGMTAVGVADYDPRYTYAERVGTIDEGSVIICCFEGDHAEANEAPSRVAERGMFKSYNHALEATAKLALVLQQQGYSTQAHNLEGPFMYVPYAQQAGLGQLGYQGILLTPFAGGRVALTAITTNATILADEPIDFGIPKICAACQACVRRCPVGAIPNHPGVHRGVTKTKINTRKCLPIVAAAEGCAACITVCPVQRYGLDEVLSHYEATGAILGRSTDELEGYTWPLDGRYYAAGDKPRVPAGVRAPGLTFDPEALYQPMRVHES